MGRSPCCSKEGLNRGAWTAMEDRILKGYIKIHGEGKWRNLPKRAGLKRCGKSCRLRWLNYLRPDIKRGNITRDEEELIIRLHKLLGNRWSLIAGRLPGRTDNEIKNYWNTNIGKKNQAPSTNGRPQEKPNPTMEEGSAPDRLKPSTGSCVVRTKATRCTRVVVTSAGPQDGHEVLPSLTHEAVDFSKSVSEESNDHLLNFMMDLEMDGNFLSDFLDVDFSLLENIGSNTCDNGNSSPAEDTLHGSDFQSVAPPNIQSSQLEWLCD